ncbi:MAG: hypothetical protein WBP59_15570, partial [Ilumatobacteraceae bacterium]
AELGKLCVGDLMVGNPDRMVYGAMNLGNVMVSMQNGRAQLAAIDTTAYLPKVVEPKDWSKYGGSTGGFNSNRSATDNPGEILDGFFEVLVGRLKRGTPDQAGPHPTWAVIESTYKNNRDHYFASFDFGWNDALITAMSLSHDRDKIDALASQYDDQDLSGDTLLANLSYLGARAEGKTHDESVGRSMAISAGQWLKSLDIDRMQPSGSDALAAKSMSTPSGKSLRAEVVAMPSLPTATNMKSIISRYGGSLGEKDYASLQKWPAAVTKAHGEVDQEVSATKQRRSRPFGKKQEQPRNRSVVSHYVAHATAMGAGGARVADAAGYIWQVSDQVNMLSGADFRGNEASPVKSLMSQMGATVPVLATHISAYKRQVRTAAATIPQTSHGENAALAAKLQEVDAYLDSAVQKLATVKKLDLQRVAAGVKSNPG